MKRPGLRSAAIALAAGLFAVLSWRLVSALPGSHAEFEPPAAFPDLTPADMGVEPADDAEVATFGSGCFWCSEAIFRRVRGVRTVVSGFSGGSVPNPSYEQVCSGTTGHAEVIQVTFDRKAVSYADLLEVFWRSHDPTTLDQQGYDMGSQYRSVIFYHSERQRELAVRYKQKIDAANVYPAPIVTEIVPFVAFYPADADHQDYYARNSRKPYCAAHIRPRLDKLKEVFGDRILVGK